MRRPTICRLGRVNLTGWRRPHCTLSRSIASSERQRSRTNVLQSLRSTLALSAARQRAERYQPAIAASHDQQRSKKTQDNILRTYNATDATRMAIMHGCPTVQHQVRVPMSVTKLDKPERGFLE